MATPTEPTEPTIRIVDNPGEARYEIYCDDQRAGGVTYRRDADKIVFLHTEIDDRFEGHGLGSRLAAAVLEEGACPAPSGRSPVPLHRALHQATPRVRRSHAQGELAGDRLASL